MTGFGRSEGRADWGTWTWEVRSVNGRSADIRYSGPPGADAVEAETRRRIKDKFNRGSFQTQLRIEFTLPAEAVSVDTRELVRLARLARNWTRAGLSASAFDSAVLAGGQKTARTSTRLDDDQTAAVLATLDEALAGLLEARLKEGAALKSILGGMLTEVDGLVAQASSLATAQPALIRDRLHARIEELTGGTTPDADRVAQEVLMAANKADVREELDRLRAHLKTGAELIGSKDPAGRKLDFLCQELNREANTLCSKSASLELTNVGLALKSVIDQFREQVQNVE
ncbi:MAG: YicC/YloC family endoribonuclease [Hyphomonadaceae bacterium]